MLIALDRNQDSGFLTKMPCNFTILESPAADLRVPATFTPPAGVNEEVREIGPCSGSSTSSIGRNSDDNSSDGDVDGEEEVQSDLKKSKSSFDSAMASLEESLPIRRGISKFYNGKSKSYASLADTTTASTSAKDIAKPETAYTRRRRNLLAYNTLFAEKGRSPLQLRSHGGGISKKPSFSSAGRSSLALAVAMGGSPAASPPMSPLAPPLKAAPLRSFSLVDLQQHCWGSSGGIMKLCNLKSASDKVST